MDTLVEVRGLVEECWGIVIDDERLEVFIDIMRKEQKDPVRQIENYARRGIENIQAYINAIVKRHAVPKAE